MFQTQDGSLKKSLQQVASNNAIQPEDLLKFYAKQMKHALNVNHMDSYKDFYAKESELCFNKKALTWKPETEIPKEFTEQTYNTTTSDLSILFRLINMFVW